MLAAAPTRSRQRPRSPRSRGRLPGRRLGAENPQIPRRGGCFEMGSGALRWDKALGLGCTGIVSPGRVRDGAATFRLASNDCPGRTSSTPNPKAWTPSPPPPAITAKDRRQFDRTKVLADIAFRDTKVSLPEDILANWPQKGDKLITTEGDRYFHVVVGDRTDLNAHIEGYKRAADLIFDQFGQEPRVIAVGWLVFPAIFLYRHFVELSLKDIISLGSYIETDNAHFPPTHDLSALWREARELIKSIGPGCTDDDLDAMGSLIQELNTIDSGSFSFRYPINKDGAPTLASLEFNLAAFRRGMGKMSGFFDGARSMLVEYKSTKGSLGY
jgi:hypothetical protein